MRRRKSCTDPQNTIIGSIIVSLSELFLCDFVASYIVPPLNLKAADYIESQVAHCSLICGIYTWQYFFMIVKSIQRIRTGEFVNIALFIIPSRPFSISLSPGLLILLLCSQFSVFKSLKLGNIV